MLEDAIMKLFPVALRDRLHNCAINQNMLEEIRVRAGQPLMFIFHDCEYFLHKNQDRIIKDEQMAYCMREDELEEMVSFLCNYSLYAYEHQLRMGYLTLVHGHRVGVCGEVMQGENGIERFLHISYLNIRIARECIGCAKHLVRAIRCNNSIYNTLIVSPPGVGKTTYLRDAIRIISDGDETYRGLKVGVVDERMEIGAAFMGISQNHLGKRTDLLSNANKCEGIQLLLRTMSPQVMALDELGGAKDFAAVQNAFYSGCKLIGTVHGYDISDVQGKLKLYMESDYEQIHRLIHIEKAENGTRKLYVYDGGGSLIETIIEGQI